MNHDDAEIQYVNRETGELETEVVLDEKYIRWAYQSPALPLLSAIVFRHALLSRMYGMYLDSSLSRRKIMPTIRTLRIDTSEFADPVDSFRSFNEFFIRRLRPECRPFDEARDCLVSPADGRVFVFPEIRRETVIPVKGVGFSVDHLLAGLDNGSFHDGDVLVIRLCPADYHRFHFPCDGRIVASHDEGGTYHSVNPIALACGLNIFCANKRTVTLIENAVFGRIAIVEVGAFGVGSIVQTCYKDYVNKMDEKGYFTFGGSTIILIFQKRRIRLSADLIEHSATGHETFVKVGSLIGTQYLDGR